MSDEYEDVEFSITEKGREAIDDITARFAKGEDLEEIAESYDIEPLAIQVLLALDAILPLEKNEY